MDGQVRVTAAMQALVVSINQRTRNIEKMQKRIQNEIFIISEEAKCLKGLIKAEEVYQGCQAFVDLLLST